MFDDCEYIISTLNMKIATGTVEESLYVIWAQKLNSSSTNTSNSALFPPPHLEEGRMAHNDKQIIYPMAKRNIGHGLKTQRNVEKLTFWGGIQGKARRSRIPKKTSSQTSFQLLSTVHADVYGPMDVPSMGVRGICILFLLLMNIRTGRLFMFRYKSQRLRNVFLKCEKLVETQNGHHIRKLHSDNGGEYLLKSLSSYFKHRGILHEPTIPYSPGENGVAERFNQSILN